MNVWLLDVNVLVARFWEPHAFHQKVRLWLDEHAHEGWATCPITQLGLVRTLSNPSFDASAPRPAAVLNSLAEALRTSRYHQFWEDSSPAELACQALSSRLTGHKQVTDAYLLGLAMQRGGRFVTLDRRLATLAPEGSPAHPSVLILQ
jgi:uncharacterized protein